MSEKVCCIFPALSSLLIEAVNEKSRRQKKGGKKMKKVICLLMACAALASAVPANAMYVEETAAPAEIVPFYVGTILASASLSIDANGNATCSGQQKINGDWEVQKSWSASGKTDITLSKSYTVSSGYSYQTVLTARVYNSEGVYVETVTASSAVVSY